MRKIAQDYQEICLPHAVTLGIVAQPNEVTLHSALKVAIESMTSRDVVQTVGRGYFQILYHKVHVLWLETV